MCLKISGSGPKNKIILKGLFPCPLEVFNESLVTTISHREPAPTSWQVYLIATIFRDETLEWNLTPSHCLCIVRVFIYEMKEPTI